MIRLLMKIAMTIPAVVSLVLNILVGLLIWDRRPFIQSAGMFNVVWSDNEPPKEEDFG